MAGSLHHEARFGSLTRVAPRASFCPTRWGHPTPSGVVASAMVPHPPGERPPCGGAQMIMLRPLPGKPKPAPMPLCPLARPCSSLLEVLDRVLNRGLLIDGAETANEFETRAKGSISLLGISLFTAKVNVVVHAAQAEGGQADALLGTDAPDATAALLPAA